MIFINFEKLKVYYFSFIFYETKSYFCMQLHLLIIPIISLYITGKLANIPPLS